MFPMQVDPLANLQQACAIALQAVPEIEYTDRGPGEEVMATLLPEDVARFQEIGELFLSVRRLSATLLHKTKRLQAQQILFWDDVHTKYEAVRDLKRNVNIGVRKGGEQGDFVLVKAQVEE